MKIIKYISILLLSILMGCAIDEPTSFVGSDTSPSAPTANPNEPVPVIAGVAYKPFASGHDDKFSLGDFDSPYLVRLDDYTNFVASNSSILLNDVPHEVTKTDYQGGVYLGIAGFSFSDYTSFIDNNTEVNIIVNLVEANGSLITNGAITNSLLITPFTEIYTWQDLQGMKHGLSGEYELMNDVTFPDGGSEGLAMEGFEPVGNNSAGDGSDNFTGSFAGGGHTIAISIERPTRDRVGIWGFVSDANSVIKDFVVDHGGISGADDVGGVVGRLNSGMVSNVGVVSSQNRRVSGTGSDVGGLVGENDAGTVHGYVTGNVFSMGFNVGGLVGDNRAGVVDGYVTGTVSGNFNIGGLVGDSSRDGRVHGYVTGAVSGTGNRVGGLVGNNSSGTVIGYATGAVNGNTTVGGLVGNNQATANGYWDQGGTGQLNGFGSNSATFNGAGISSITNVVYDSGAGTYTDTKGTAVDPDDDDVIFDNMAFTNNFSLPGASATWPTLK